MLHVVAYLLASYACVVVANGVLSCLVVRASSRRRRRVLVASMLATLLLPLLPYGWVECTTRLYGKCLLAPTRDALVSAGYSDRIRVLKVLSIHPFGATVYVVTPCASRFTSGHRGTVLGLRPGPTGWEFSGDEDTRWSDCTSANGNVFPPYRSQGDYPTPPAGAESRP